MIANPDRVRNGNQPTTGPVTRALCGGSEQIGHGLEASQGRANCPRCGGSYRLKLDGTLVKHRGSRD